MTPSSLGRNTVMKSFIKHTTPGRADLKVSLQITIRFRGSPIIYFFATWYFLNNSLPSWHYPQISLKLAHLSLSRPSMLSWSHHNHFVILKKKKKIAKRLGSFENQITMLPDNICSLVNWNSLSLSPLQSGCGVVVCIRVIWCGMCEWGGGGVWYLCALTGTRHLSSPHTISS